MTGPSGLLTPRWTPLRYHAIQHAYEVSPHRFNIVSAGRRSGKTEKVKRKIVRCAVAGTDFDNARFFAAAPIRDQAKRIYWRDLKALTPPWMLAKPPSETELIIWLINDSEIHVLGMDKPERIEGSPWDGGALDEYANMKEGAWGENVRPALADRNGWCDLIGVPEGRNHYYEMDQRAQAEVKLRGDAAEFGSFTWKSSDILLPSEIEAARRDLPPLVFAQEYEGAFVDWSGVEFFSPEKWLMDGEPIPMPTRCDVVFATIDTALKTGREHDGTAVLYCATSKHPVFPSAPLMLLDYDLVQIEGGLLEVWLPSVYQRLEQLTRECGSRSGCLGAFIEDTGAGTVLLQQARRRNMPVHAVASAFVAMGKDERAVSVSGYHHQGLIKITEPCYNKISDFKGSSANHLIRQVSNFRIGDPEAAKRADDLVDTYTSAVSLALGDREGY